MVKKNWVENAVGKQHKKKNNKTLENWAVLKDKVTTFQFYTSLYLTKKCI